MMLADAFLAITLYLFTITCSTNRFQGKVDIFREPGELGDTGKQ